MRCEEAEQYLYYAMTIGEQLLISGAEVGRVEDTIRRQFWHLYADKARAWNGE